MERVNGRIVVSTLIIMAAGLYRVYVVRDFSTRGAGGVTLIRVIVGGYMLALVASIIDLAGGPASTVAGLLMGLAVLTALYAVLPDLFQRFSSRKGA
ncbi:MAG TPA: hypothetical protein VF916_11440 [Ktedonobacterales bacterium]